MDISLPRENHPDIVSLAGPMSNNLADDGGVRKREMRRARNQRYQERRKQRAKEKQRAEECVLTQLQVLVFLLSHVL